MNCEPKVNQTLDNAAKGHGEKFSVNVECSGETPLKKLWYFNGRVLEEDFDHVGIIYREYSTKLIILDVSRELHQGEYSLVVSNVYGDSEPGKFNLTVTDVPDAPEGPLIVDDVMATTCKLWWQPPADDGGEPVTKYIIDRMDELDAEWATYGEVGGSELEIPISGLKREHRYDFKVWAVNRNGKSLALQTLEKTLARDYEGVPRAPIKVEVTDFDFDHVWLRWKPPG